MDDMNMRVYCPVMKAILSINSTLIEQMGEFTQFVLYAIGRGFSVEDIDDTIELGEYLVREEIFHLEKWGLVVECGGNIKLTDLGERYFKSIELVDYINSSCIQVQINCFNGFIMDYKGSLISRDLCEDKIQKLNINIVRELYQNKNCSNSREYFNENFEEIMVKKFKLSHDDIDTINVHLNYDSEILYKMMFVDLGDLDDNKNIDITLVRKEIKLKVDIENRNLGKYRYTADTLMKIGLFDDELLSQKSKDIIEMWKEERAVQNNLCDVYFDTATCTIHNEVVNDCDRDSNSKLYNLYVPMFYSIDKVDHKELSRMLDLGEDYILKVDQDSIVECYDYMDSKNLKSEVKYGQ